MSADASFILQELHLYNWGAFAGRHQVSIDPGNSAIIGPTGSGKTTLVDALMTLLCASPRYNLASTGGHESDRDLVSYVRGASGQGNDSGDHIARPGRCATGVAARLVRGGGGETVWLGALLWFDGSSQSAGDMQKRWLFAQGESHSLDLWLEEQHSGGARALTRLAKDSDGLQMFVNNKTAYLAKLHSFFEVGPNAFTLLNRAAGLKQLNSIDEIFRELVLDDHSAFDDAQKVVDGFAELASIHADLELANAQFVALLPLRDLAAREQQQAQQLAHLQMLQQQLPPWFSAQGVRWWGQRVAQLQAQIKERSQDLQTAQTRVGASRQHEQALHGIYLQAGGASLESLRENIQHAHKELARTQNNLAQYQALARNLGLGAQAGVAHLPAHQTQAQAATEQIDAGQTERQAAAESAITKAHNAQTHRDQIEAEYEAVRQRPGSNLPVDFQHFRSDLAEHLKLPDEALPFVAELVEVQKAEQGWRGAIERALGSHRLRILVPHGALRAALQWVNQRHNRLHVRLLEVQGAAAPATFLADGFARKLNLKPTAPTAHQNTLRQLLAGLDRHCVPDVETLERTPHAMTAQGLMSSQSGRFDKQDHKRLDQDWMTGFDNRDRLAQLLQQKEHIALDWQALEAKKTHILDTQRRAQEQRQLWASLQTLRSEDLDTAAAQAQLEHKEQQLQALLHPQSDAAQAQQRWEAAQTQTREAEGQLRDLQTAQTQDATLLDTARKKHGAFQARAAGTTAADEDVAEQLARLGRRLPPLDGDNLEAQEREAGAALQAKTSEASKKLGNLHTDIVRQMGKAKGEDRGVLVDHGQEVEALPHYLQRLQTLEEEALPQKRQRFQEYLNKTSQQGVDTLLNGIAAQVADIEERIAQLNGTLRRVDFQPGRYLQLEPRAVVHQSLQELSRAQAQLRTESLRDDGGYSHYRALRAIVEMLQTHASNRRGKAAQALLDARYRLQFAVLVQDRGSGQMLERRTGSQGGSGGEKEIIASYVLTASLSYALCPDGASRPVFGTIVLDEAFSKSSQAVAARIIQALREFGLHALFVTPNKEVRLLRNHTRSAVVVHRRDAQATLASLRWEEIDSFRRGVQSMPTTTQA